MRECARILPERIAAGGCAFARRNGKMTDTLAARSTKNSNQ